jgi:hypothetical protein
MTYYQDRGASAAPQSREEPSRASLGLPDEGYLCVYTPTEPRCELCGAPMLVTEVERRELWGVCDRCYEAAR